MAEEEAENWGDISGKGGAEGIELWEGVSWASTVAHEQTPMLLPPRPLNQALALPGEPSSFYRWGSQGPER